MKDPVRFISTWLTSHIDNARSLGKPFIVEEFGKSLDKHDPGTIATVRDPIFKVVYDALSNSLNSDGYFKGNTSTTGILDTIPSLMTEHNNVSHDTVLTYICTLPLQTAQCLVSHTSNTLSNM